LGWGGGSAVLTTTQALSLTISTTRTLNVAHGVFFVWGWALIVMFSQRMKLHPVLCIALLTAFFFMLALPVQ
jgi:branched-subunit amino acid ABC-type transport system permease component